MTQHDPEAATAAVEPDVRGPDERRGAATGRGSWLIRAGLLLPVLALLGLFGAAVIRHQGSLAIGTALARGEAPPMPALTLPGLDGPPISLAALRGHPVIINFWASWCVPCREEAPLLEEMWNEFQSHGLLVIGVDTQDMEQPARAFLKEFRLTYPSLRDPDGSAARRFGITGVPETFFVDAAGRIRGKFPGVEVRATAWRDAARGLLSGRPHVP